MSMKYTPALQMAVPRVIIRKSFRVLLVIHMAVPPLYVCPGCGRLYRRQAAPLLCNKKTVSHGRAICQQETRKLAQGRL